MIQASKDSAVLLDILKLHSPAWMIGMEGQPGFSGNVEGLLWMCALVVQNKVIRRKKNIKNLE